MKKQKDSKVLVFVGDSINNGCYNPRPDLSNWDSVHPTQEGYDLLRIQLIKSGTIPLEVEEVKSGNLPEHKPEDKTDH